MSQAELSRRQFRSTELRPTEIEPFNPRDIAVATTTFYKGWAPLAEGATREAGDVDGNRGDLALKMLTEAQRQGFQLAVVDGGSSDAFRATLANVIGKPASDEQQRGMSQSRRQVFGEASALNEARVVAWIEPEKVAMAQGDNLKKAAAPILSGEADVVLPKRDATAFASYPEHQVPWEQDANRQFNDILRTNGLLPEDAEDLDAWFGPRLFKNTPEVTKFFMHQWERDDTHPDQKEKTMEPELWAGAIFLPVVAKLYEDRLNGNPPSVVSVPVDYVHPREQKEFEEANEEIFGPKREQQSQNILGATRALVQVFNYDEYGKDGEQKDERKGDHLYRPDKEQPRLDELAPTPGVVDALRGTVEDATYNQNGEIKTDKVVTEGSGQFGLTDLNDNKTWRGIFHHSVLSARYSAHLGIQLLEAYTKRQTTTVDKKNKPNPQTIVDAMIVSHTGRRRKEQKEKTPEAIIDPEAERVTNETLGLQNIEGKVPEQAFQLVAALAHKPEGYPVAPDVKASWNYFITSYVDHRTTDRWQPLNERLGDFLYGNFVNEKTPERREEIHRKMNAIIEAQKAFVRGEKGAEPVTLDVADAIAESLGANEGSSRLSRRELMELVLQDAGTEAVLQMAGIDTENMNETTVPMPQWEDDLRYQYVAAAQNEIVDHLSELSGEPELTEIMDREFPTEGTHGWWGKAAREVFAASREV